VYLDPNKKIKARLNANPEKQNPIVRKPLKDKDKKPKKESVDIFQLKQANLISRKQLSQRYDEYIDSMRNLRLILDNLLASAPEKYNNIFSNTSPFLLTYDNKR
ncbi:unnamed protein product, partial [marine sediment metagenome]